MPRPEVSVLHPVSRRSALKQLGTAGAGVLFANGIIRGQDGPIRIAGRPVEIAVFTVSLSAPYIHWMSVDVASANGTAISGPDFAGLSRKGDCPNTRGC